jgi:HSP20 family protein
MTRDDRWYEFPLRLPKELDRLFDEIIHRPWGIQDELTGWNPSVDLYETPDGFILEADLPGVKGDDVKVEVKDTHLLLRGRRSSEQSHTDGRFYCRERSFGDFSRRIALPESVDKDRIQAGFNNGVLRVLLPKLKRKAGTS